MSRNVEKLTIFISYVGIIMFFPITIFFCVEIVMEFERMIVFRLGRLRPGGARGPGVVFVLPCTDTYEKVDMRIATVDVFPQEILSRDSVAVRVDAIIYYYICDPLRAIIQVHDYSYSTAMLGATILRNVLGTKNLKHILTDRRAMSDTIQSILDEATGPWGVKVQRVEIQEIKLPLQMQRAMATEAEAAREAKAKVIAAEGELKSSKTLKQASDIISQGSAALQLRYLQTLNNLSTEKKSTILFPIPLEILPASSYQK